MYSWICYRLLGTIVTAQRATCLPRTRSVSNLIQFLIHETKVNYMLEQALRIGTTSAEGKNSVVSITPCSLRILFCFAFLWLLLRMFFPFRSMYFEQIHPAGARTGTSMLENALNWLKGFILFPKSERKKIRQTQSGVYISCFNCYTLYSIRYSVALYISVAIRLMQREPSRILNNNISLRRRIPCTLGTCNDNSMLKSPWNWYSRSGEHTMMRTTWVYAFVWRMAL